MNQEARYVKLVEWSEEDGCFIGSCPELFYCLILYIAEEDKIIITAIAHQHRHPDHYHYLKRRNNI